MCHLLGNQPSRRVPNLAGGFQHPQGDWPRVVCQGPDGGAKVDKEDIRHEGHQEGPRHG